MTKANELLTTAEAAAALCCYTRTVTRLAISGDLRTFQKLPGLRGQRIFHRDEVARVAAERALGGVAQPEEQPA